MLEVFKECCAEGPDGMTLVIAGFVNDKAYVEDLRKQAAGYPVTFRLNVSNAEMKELYASAAVYWHGAGFGQDLQSYPEKAEHFGMTTVEAMAAGCVPIVFNAGGQPDIVKTGDAGLVWSSTEQLKIHTLRLLNDHSFWTTLSEAALRRSRDFAKERFAVALQQHMRCACHS
jgi:glycosyltransferase involved in cell wall biosynthesis